MSDDHFVNLGHLITLLDPSQFDEIPDRLFVDNLDDFRDNLEEQMQQKGFGDRIKNITRKCVKALRYVENTEQLFAEGEAIIGKYSPRRSRGEYSPKITEPEANNCFSIFTHSSEYKI